ncbi:class I SAM-dependent methyltransferase [Actinomadura sp. SCN-SB]|uniref:class I SAM-dependent methyltransferase n=1 Tax=Actinomadura sp. SCN-SB TaxID=3373092 RepID=UPI003751C980
MIADIGCGTGHPTRTLAGRSPTARLLAIDASTAMLIAARTHLQAQPAATANASPTCATLPSSRDWLRTR